MWNVSERDVKGKCKRGMEMEVHTFITESVKSESASVVQYWEPTKEFAQGRYLPYVLRYSDH